MDSCLLPYQIPARIYPEEDEQQYREAPKRRAAVREERQRDADDRRQSQDHPDIDEQVEEEYAQHAVAVYPSELEWLAFCHMYQSEY